MSCLKPDRSPFTGYKAGCRCERCKGNMADWGRKWRSKDPEKHVKRSQEYRDKNRAKVNKSVNDRRKIQQAKIWQIKSQPCKDCGGLFHPCAMDFDHRDPSQKVFEIGPALSRNWEKVQAEIAKCDVVCSNCHRVRTFKRMSNRKKH